MRSIYYPFILFILFNPAALRAQCSLDLGADTVICPPGLIILDAGAGYSNYLWQDGSTNQTHVVFMAGTYWCQVNDANPTSNLIVNGDFESGNSNFTTDYSIGTGGTWGPISNVETYLITNNSNTAHSNFVSCGDNTTGSGNMMVTNGSTTAGQNIWCQTVTVTPNTNYLLSAWFQIYGNNPPDVSFMINGSQVGTSFTSSINGCQWQNHSVSWNSGANTTADVCFINNELAGSGNDFSMDDISFGPVCVATDTIVITDGLIQASLGNITNASCANSANGSATVSNVNGSMGPYTITWTDPNGTVHYTGPIAQGGSNVQNNLFPGVWNVTVSNGTGCDFTDNFIIGSGSINFTINPNNPHCYDQPTGSIVVTTSDTSSNFSFVIEDSGGNVVNAPGSNAANNLPSGTYTVTYSDDNGCVLTDIITLTDPPEILPTISVINPRCYGDAHGSAYVTNIINFQGSADSISYVWTPNPAGVNGLGADSTWGLPAGDYVLDIEDAFGCTTTEQFTITEPNPLIGIISDTVATLCRTAGYQSGSGLLAAYTEPNTSGTGTPTYQWLHLGSGQSSNNSTFNGIREPGHVELTITDVNGCQFKDTVYLDSINPTADFILESDDFYNPTIYEGTENVKVKLINLSSGFGQANNANSDTIFQLNLFTNQIPGGDQNWFFTFDLDEPVDTTYGGEQIYQVCLIAKNYNNCADTLCEDVIVHAITELVTPNVFTPGSPPNEFFFFPGLGIGEFKCTVFNRYGVRVYEFNDVDDQWDGTHYKTGKPCSDGIYFYSYQARSTNGTPINGEGQIHLIQTK